MTEQRTSGTATVMFTDVEASTDLTTRLGDDAAAELLAAHDTIVLEQVSAHGGRDVRSTGDGFLVVFDSARAAVSCALAIQHELSRRGHGLRVRIGLNAGEVLGGGEPFGAAINLAARVVDRADGGEILTTDTVRQLVGTMNGTRFRDRGRVALKGFAERQRLYEVQPAEPPPRRDGGEAAPPGRRPRRARILLGVAVVTVVIAAAVVALATGEPDPVRVPANAVAVIDPGSASVVGAIGVDENPGPVAAGAGALWVLNLNSATLSRIDMRTRRVVDTIGIGGSPGTRGKPGNLAASPDEVWLNAAACNGNGPGDLLHVFSTSEAGTEFNGGAVPLAGAVPAHPVPPTAPGGCGLAASGATAWVGTNHPEGIARVDSDRVTGRSRIVWGRPMGVPSAIAVGHGSVWAVEPLRQVVRRIDPGSGRTAAILRAGAEPAAIAVDAQEVWVANAGDNSVSRIDPRTNDVTQAIAVGSGPVALATGAGAVWVALADAGSVARIDPRTNQVTDTIRVGHRPQGVAVAGGLVWVSVRS